jgi:two-component system probable response regulator PhcQ
VTTPDPRLATGRLTSVLLVDDEPEILEGLRRTLRREPYRLVTAQSADEAMRVIESESIDVIVSDIDMPGTNGLDLIARIRRDHPMIVRLLLTGDASLEAALQAINQGEVHRFLTKPWDSAELRRTLGEAIVRLEELRRAATAAGMVGSRERIQAALERTHPGITRIDFTANVYVIDPATVAAWFETVTEPRLRQAFAIADEALDREHTRRIRNRPPTKETP